MGIRHLDGIAENIIAKRCAADRIRQINKHRKTAMFLKNAVSHCDQSRFAGMVNMTKEEIRWSGGRSAIDAENDIWSYFAAKVLRLGTILPAVMSSIDNRQHAISDSFEDSKFERIKRLTESQPAAIRGRAWYEQKLAMVQHQFTNDFHSMVQEIHAS
jgi:hypothetical protein